MHTDNIAMLEQTLAICEAGHYTRGGKTVSLKLSAADRKDARVFLPDELERLKTFRAFEHAHVIGRCRYSCENTDSFSLARAFSRNQGSASGETDAKRVLVLNLANPVNPGGGVRRGARAQEEDLCRKSTLLLSLEGTAAASYYRYNRSLNTYMGSDAVIVTPKVEILRDENGNLLDETVVVAVMTCAAPMVTHGYAGRTQAQYEQLVYERICGMLRCAAFLGYQTLVLGAFGCGAFGNDARVVSDLFYQALKEFDFDGMSESDMFRQIGFAVLCSQSELYNYREFARNFGEGNFYRDENEADRRSALQKAAANESTLDKIRGSLVGGAIGDALGYPVEFFSEELITMKYGAQGITSYALDRASGKALISDDTQMTLFTANGILVGETRLCMRGIGGVPHDYVQKSYQDWLTTQNMPYKAGRRAAGGISWLLDVPELYSRRAPGSTCLSALEEARGGNGCDDYLKDPRNNSKGCGGIMRVAPLGLHCAKVAIKELDQEGAMLAAITHGHSLGYMPSAVLTHILNRIVYPTGKRLSLVEIIDEAKNTVSKLFAGDAHLSELCCIMDLAVALSGNGRTDRENIRQIGQGWVAEETLGIALYCALRYERDFSKGIIAAVNHDGDSDSTGAVTGNILGAIHGYAAIEEKWKENLELRDVLLEMSDDLCRGCCMGEYSSYYDPHWARKYIDMRWRERKPPCIFFWHEYEENGCFSNWFTSPFTVAGVRYLHVEQFLMAQKAKLFHDTKSYTAILHTDTPEECKKLGRAIPLFDAAKWDAVKYDVLLAGVRAKFTQNPELRQALLATGDYTLAEASPHDSIYGICLPAAVATAVPPEQWPGQNLLGKALMQLREELADPGGQTPL